MENIVTATILTPSQKAALLHLWNTEYPAQLAHPDITSLDNYLDTLQNATHFFLMIDEAAAAWATIFTRDGERWFAIITARHIQGKGYGKQLMELLKTKETTLYGWVTDHNRYTKADGTPYPSPLTFYTKLGLTTTGIRLETQKLSAIKIKWCAQSTPPNS